MSALATFQDRFTDAVRGGHVDEAMAALVVQPAFAIYRNTALAGCIDAVEANFPAVTCLVGRDWLRAAAAAYAGTHPPDDARMLFYGRDFPRFLAEHASVHGLHYIADVATIDRLCTEASAAADAPVIDLASLGAVPTADLARMCLVPHPAVRWQRFALPACTLWHASSKGMTGDDELAWRPECVLVTRTGGTPVVTSVSPEACALLDACARGESLQQAIAHGASPYTERAMHDDIAGLFHAGAFTTFSILTPEFP